MSLYYDIFFVMTDMTVHLQVITTLLAQVSHMKLNEIRTIYLEVVSGSL